MASQGYREWVAAGKPFTLAAPQKALRNRLRAYGYTVYDIGNQAHLTKATPEDHTPFSATGWPRTSPRWYGFALDIMPPPPGSGLPSLAQLAGQIYADKVAGVDGTQFVKYMNWEPSGPGGPCYHDKWEPDHVRTRSGDRGHIHLSGRSDHYLTDTTSGYDPVARFRNGEADDMTPEDVQAACLRAIHQAVDIAANRSNPTGRQIGDDLTALLAPLAGKLDAISAAVAELEDDGMTQAELDAFADAVAARLTPLQAVQLANALTLRFAADAPPTSSN